MDHHGDICSDAASGSSYDWNILFESFQASRNLVHFDFLVDGLLMRHSVQISVILFLGFLFYSLDYFFRISQSIIVTPLMQQYHITAIGIGSFASAFYLGYALCQIPVGYCLERLPTHVFFSASAFLCSISYCLFLFCHHFWLGYLLRFVIGATSAVSFIGILYLARVTLSSNTFSLVAGLAISIGTVSASLVQVLGVFLMKHLSWQVALSLFALTGMLVSLLFLLCSPPKTPRRVIHFTHLRQGLRDFFNNKTLVMNAAVGSLFYLPTTLFASLWGVPFLTTVKHLDASQATYGIFFLFLGWAVGAPFMNLLANKVQQPYHLIRYCAMTATLLTLLLIYSPVSSETLLFLLLLGLGLLSSAQAIVWRLFDLSCPAAFSGLGIACTNTVIMLMGSVFHLVIGLLMQTTAPVNQSDFHYQLGLLLMPLSFLLVALSAGFLTLKPAS